MSTLLLGIVIGIGHLAPEGAFSAFESDAERLNCYIVRTAYLDATREQLARPVLGPRKLDE